MGRHLRDRGQHPGNRAGGDRGRERDHLGAAVIVTDRSPLAVTDYAGNDTTRSPLGLPLTPRQQMILRLLAEGYTSQQVQHQCGISKHTFWNHIKDAKARIGAGTTVRAVVLYALAKEVAP